MVVSSVGSVCWGPARRTARRCHDAPQNTGKLKYSKRLSKKKFITFQNENDGCAGVELDARAAIEAQLALRPRNRKNRLNTLSIGLRILAVLLLLAVGLSFANDPRPAASGAEGGWRGAARHSAGIAPDPERFADTAIVQVYAAATYGWRGYFAVHPWIIYKRAGDTVYTRYDVIGWGRGNVVRRNYALPDGLWFGAVPRVLVEHRGEGVEAMIGQIEAAVASYPHADEYRSYPGPNSNTFLAHIGREVPALRLDLPANAIGKDYRPVTRPLGVSPSGSGVQFSLLGLLGLSVGVQEGIELNVLGLNFGWAHWIERNESNPIQVFIAYPHY